METFSTFMENKMQKLFFLFKLWKQILLLWVIKNSFFLEMLSKIIL